MRRNVTPLGSARPMWSLSHRGEATLIGAEAVTFPVS